jgi:hypothetical protein
LGGCVGVKSDHGKDLIMMGNSDGPSLVRPRIDGKGDIIVNNGIVKSQADVQWPQGKSSFDTIENAANVVSRQTHKVPANAPLPEGLRILADGREVGGPHSKGHHTIFPTRDMPFDEYASKVKSIQSEHIGKIDNGKFKPKRK